MEERINELNHNNQFFQIEKSKSDTIREKTDKQSDRILQNILNASKLLEGRITFEQLIRLDIPNFERLVNNEFANIDKSYKDFKERGIVNAYTKHESTSSYNDAALKELQKQTSLK